MVEFEIYLDETLYSTVNVTYEDITEDANLWIQIIELPYDLDLSLIKVNEIIPDGYRQVALSDEWIQTFNNTLLENGVLLQFLL